MSKKEIDNMIKAIDRNWITHSNKWLILLFAVLWMFDCGLTIWAINNGYLEVWNQWTKIVSSNSLLFILIKLVTLGMVIGIGRWAQKLFPDVVFIAMVAFNMLVGTVTAANIITIIKT